MDGERLPPSFPPSTLTFCSFFSDAIITRYAPRRRTRTRASDSTPDDGGRGVRRERANLESKPVSYAVSFLPWVFLHGKS